MIIFYNTLKRIFKDKLSVLLLFIMPIPLAFIPSSSNAVLPDGAYIFGLNVLFSAFLMGKLVIEDRQKGVAIRIASSPIGYTKYLVEHLCASMVLLSIQAFVFVVALNIVHLNLGISIIPLFLYYITFSIMSISLVLFWNSMFRQYVISLAIFSGFISLVALISGITIRLTVFPEMMQKIVMILPTYWLPYGLEALFHDNISMVILSFLVLISFSALFITVGSRRRFG